MSIPHSMSAERAILGQCMVGGLDLLAQVASLVAAEDFYREAHRNLFAVMLGMMNKGQPVEMVSVVQEVASTGLGDACGGVAYLSAMPEDVPSVENFAHYCGIVRAMKVRRDLLDASRETAEAAQDMTIEATEALDRSASRVLAIDGEGSQAGGWVSSGEAVAEALDRVHAIVARGDAIEISTGFTELDRVLAGLHRTDLVILAARPAMGKTALALNIAANVAQQGHSVGIFSLEMSAGQLVTRLMVTASGVYAGKVRTGDLDQRDLDRLNAAGVTVHDWPIEIDDTPGLSITKIRARARRLRAMHPNLALLVVDYIGLLQGEGKEGRQQQIADASRGLKILAKEMGVCVLALSQLNRNCEHRSPPIPQLSDLRESGAIEQDADVIMFIYRDDYYQPETSTRPGEADVIVAKQRNGPTKTVALAFNGSLTQFSDLAPHMPASGDRRDFPPLDSYGGHRSDSPPNASRPAPRSHTGASAQTAAWASLAARGLSRLRVPALSSSSSPRAAQPPCWPPGSWPRCAWRLSRSHRRGRGFGWWPAMGAGINLGRIKETCLQCERGRLLVLCRREEPARQPERHHDPQRYPPRTRHHPHPVHVRARVPHPPPRGLLPSARRPVNAELEALGFVQPYDGTDSVELSDAATSRGEDGSTVIFERNGRMHDWLQAQS